MKSVKELFKQAARAVALVAVLPAACVACFGRFIGGFRFCGQALALIPGGIGSYLRVAYYSLTLEECGEDFYMEFGSYFCHRQTSVGSHVGIGSYCVIGQVDLGDKTLIASSVQILSGSQQHVRDASGRLTDEGRSFRRLSIGPECWVGVSSVIMADLGARVTVAAGSVVSMNVQAGATVAGNPCRVVRLPSVEAKTT